MHRVVVDSPVGPIELLGDDDALTAVTIVGRGRLPGAALGTAPGPVVDRAARQLAEYFAGERLEFELPLRPTGTPFRQAVWQRIAAIPHGTAVTYSRIGADLGYPSAASRAIGTAVGANPLTIVVPCHRVLAADGRITGYSGGDGIPTKRFLLDLEGIPYR